MPDRTRMRERRFSIGKLRADNYDMRVEQRESCTRSGEKEYNGAPGQTKTVTLGFMRLIYAKEMPKVTAPGKP